MADQPFDVRRAIEKSANKTTIQELAKKGIHRVKVLDEAAIQRLIDEAVKRTLVSSSDTLSEADRERIYKKSRQELDKLMKEHKDLKDRTELAAADKSSLIRDVENLQEQLKIQRKMVEERGRERYDEGKAAMQEQMQALKDRMGGMETEIRRRVTAESEAKAAKQGSGQAEEMGRIKGELTAKIQEVATLTASKDMMQSQVTDLRQKADDALKREREAQDKLVEAQKAASVFDEKLFDQMQKLFQKSIEGMEKKLNDLKLRSLAGGVGVGGGEEGMEDFRLSAGSMESLLSNELESNLKGMDSGEQKTAGKIGSALDRLKKLRGGGGKKKEEEK